MNNFFDTKQPLADIDRVDGKAKVTGLAQYAAEHDLQGLMYGVLASSTVTKGTYSGLQSSDQVAIPVKGALSDGAVVVPHQQNR